MASRCSKRPNTTPADHESSSVRVSAGDDGLSSLSAILSSSRPRASVFGFAAATRSLAENPYSAKDASSTFSRICSNSASMADGSKWPIRDRNADGSTNACDVSTTESSVRFRCQKRRAAIARLRISSSVNLGIGVLWMTPTSYEPKAICSETNSRNAELFTRLARARRISVLSPSAKTAGPLFANIEPAGITLKLNPPCVLLGHVRPGRRKCCKAAGRESGLFVVPVNP